MAAISSRPPPNTMTALVSSTKWRTSEEDWESHKALIRQLYLEQDRPLKDVMAIMQQNHGFKATTKMYKNHITKWELDKRHKAHEIMAILRKKRQRDAVGKASEFHIRGRLVSIDDAYRYLKRKGMSVDDAIALRAATPPNFRCCTPELVPSSLSNPEIFEDFQQIFISIRNYVIGAVESRMWFLSSGCLAYDSVKGTEANNVLIFSSSLRTACDVLGLGCFEKAGQFLVRGSSVIRNLLFEEDPQTLPNLFDVVFRLRQSGWTEFSNIILNQFSEMAAAVLPEIHPLRMIFHCLTLLNPELAEDILDRVWRSFLDIFEETSGASSIDTVRYRGAYIFMSGVREPETAEAQFLSMVGNCKEVHGNLHPRYIEALLSLANFLCFHGRYRETAAAAREVISVVCRHGVPHAAALWCSAMELLARSQYELFDDESAEMTLRQVVKESCAWWGWEDARTLQLLTKLEEWLSDLGKFEEAAKSCFITTSDSLFGAAAEYVVTIVAKPNTLSRVRVNDHDGIQAYEDRNN